MATKNKIKWKQKNKDEWGLIKAFASLVLRKTSILFQKTKGEYVGWTANGEANVLKTVQFILFLYFFYNLISNSLNRNKYTIICVQQALLFVFLLTKNKTKITDKSSNCVSNLDIIFFSNECELPKHKNKLTLW